MMNVLTGRIGLQRFVGGLRQFARLVPQSYVRKGK